MNKFIRILFLLLISAGSLLAQESNMRDVVILKNGEKIHGEIVSVSDEILILITEDGKRFQFQLSEISSLEKEVISQKNDTKPNHNQGNFAGIAELNGGITKASSTEIPASPTMALSLAFGSKNAFKSNVFLGLGVGYETILTKDKSQSMSFLPVFLQIHKTLSENKIAPFVASNLGYAFKMNENYGGGAYFKLSGGVNFQITQKSAFNIGIFGKIQKISGTIIENNNLGEFVTEGNTKMFSTGLSAAFIF